VNASSALSAADAPRLRATTKPVASVWLCIAIVGAMLNMLAYQSWQPLFVAMTLYGAAYVVLLFTGLGGTEERRTFNACFATAWCMAGVAAMYMHFMLDPVQSNDAEDFYVLASDPYASARSITGLQALTSGAGAIVLWRNVYDFFSALGLERGRYIGITVNSLAVALNAVVTVKIARELFGNDSGRLKRLTVVLATCGIYALFASIHLRDALVLLGVTTLTYAWVRYLRRSGLKEFLVVSGATALSAVVLPLLRTEFFFVPIAMTLAGVAAILLFDPARNGRRGFIICLVGVGIVLLAKFLIQYQDAIQFLLTTGHKNYAATSAAESGAGSLGNALIMSAPFLLRLVLGSVYLYVFPIPVWTGFQLKSAYYLFTSLTAIYFYVVVPLVIVAMSRIFGDKSRRTPATMFLVFLAIGFTIAIAGTSIETRHLGAFLVSFQVLAVIPDLRIRDDLNAYRGSARLFITAIVAVHIAWAVLKFVG
jgi:hypothetical protein